LVYNGVCVRKGDKYFHSETFAAFLRELTSEFTLVRYFGFYIDERDAGSAHTGETLLSNDNLVLTVVRGNTVNTSPGKFIRNYVVALWRLTRFMLGATQVVVFVPSFISVAGGFLALALRKELGLYIGGNWGEETRHRNLNLMQRIAYPLNRYAVDPATRWIARRARFVVTPGYDSFRRLQRVVRKVLLPVPLLNITCQEVSDRDDTCHRNEIVLLFVGALRIPKGVLDLVAAFADLRARLANRHLVLRVVGSGEAETAMRERAYTMQVANSIEFLGHVRNGPRLFDMYRQADLFVLPSYSEGFARSLYEAMTFALPIVSTTVGGIPYLLDNGRHAVLVQPGDVRALTSALLSVITDEALRRRLIAEARKLMVQEVYPRIERDGSLAAQIRREFWDSEVTSESNR
jgi:glycosyltransferase involved in cell wall biosynthesis